MEEKVSIITPTYNSEKYISCTIRSVQNQTYKNWEMIIVDDCSTDSTCEIVRNFIANDCRIRLYIQDKNAGAGVARTRAVKEAKGKYIAYLDADDIWKPKKLEKQVMFMKEKNIGFSCTSYETIDNDGNKLNKQIHMLPEVDYFGFLTNNLLQTVGIMVDISKVDKDLLNMPNIRRRQDAATWLQVLKAGYKCYGMNAVLAEYRRTKNSLSSNKIKAIEGIWYLYRKIEKLSLPFSCYCFVRYAIFAIWKRIYHKGNSSKKSKMILGRKKVKARDVYRFILNVMTKVLGVRFTKRIDASLRFHRKIDLKNPHTLSDKLCWLELNRYELKKIKCTDKYEVRKYVKNKGLEEILVPLCAPVCERIDDIKFDKLPKQFAMKATHGCEMNLICDDKEKLDRKILYKKAKEWFDHDYARACIEVHYKKIPHRIIFEEYLQDTESIIDYKIHCFHGRPDFILVCTSRASGLKLNLYTLEWKPINEIVGIHKNNKEIKKPEHLERMIEISEVLSKDFDFVRVDLYDIKGHIYFGELTFSPASGILPYLSDKFNEEKGAKLSL